MFYARGGVGDRVLHLLSAVPVLLVRFLHKDAALANFWSGLLPWQCLWTSNRLKSSPRHNLLEHVVNARSGPLAVSFPLPYDAHDCVDVVEGVLAADLGVVDVPRRSVRPSLLV